MNSTNIKKDDVKLELENGVVLYMDKIVAFTADQVVYGLDYIDVSPEKMELLKNKKDNYELLKLSISQNDLRRFIDEQGTEVVKDYFNKNLDSDIQNIKEKLNKLSREVSETTNTMINYRDILSTNINVQKDIETNLNNLFNNMANDKHILTAKDAYTKSKSYLDEAISELNKTTANVEKTYKSLQELFE